MLFCPEQIVSFQEYIWRFYALNKRTFAWRQTHNPYHIVVSEIMLQQTQTHRVIPKYEQFILEFPDFSSLAQASLKDVLSVWQGLGYNRRGKALHEVAQCVESNFAGALPQDPEILETFPGIGKATAASICAFAFNQPTVFIETNIRTVFIHAFFNTQKEVHDKELLPIASACLDRDNPREWYYALMDYGVYLKKTCPNPSRKSAHHSKQSKFEGSDRQIRGMIIKVLTSQQCMTEQNLIEATQKEAERVKKIIMQLCAEGLLIKKHTGYEIA